MVQFFDAAAGKLVKLEVDSESDEDALQNRLASHPELLGGEELDPNDPRRFLLIKREVHDQGVGYVDHLFVDQTAVPALVEAKLSSNHESRREVVGQLLDYASNAASSWTADKLKGWLAKRCDEEGLEPEVVLQEFEPEPSDHDQFWIRVEENLRAGNIRLIFACDEVPSSLRRMVEFLNERMKPTEVLALEVSAFQSDDRLILSSNLVGATERSQALKGRPRKPDAIPALIEKEALHDGQDLWLIRDRLAGSKPDDKRDPRLRVVLSLTDSGPPKLLYEPPGGESRLVAPSQIYHEVRREIDPNHSVSRATKVADKIETADGTTLEDLCYEVEAWEDGGNP